MSTLGTQRLVGLSLSVPPGGGWWSESTIESGNPPADGSLVTLTVSDLKLVGRVVRSGLDSPDQPRVVVAGGLGWRTSLAAGAYASAGGVRLSTVIADLARAAKEPIVAPPEVLLGVRYGWDASTPQLPVSASAVLAELISRKAIPTWRVAPDGNTRFDAWPALGPADSRCRIVSRNMSRGQRTCKLDSFASAFLPGGTLEGVRIARVLFTEANSELTATAWDA